jgi:F0F1-type ATP synthase assembly protein I
VLRERAPRSFGGDLLVIGFQIAVVVGVPLLAAAWIGDALDRNLGTAPALGLVSILVGLAVAGLGTFVVLRRYLAANPDQPASDKARAAGRAWEREIDERERRREAGEEDE